VYICNQITTTKKIEIMATFKLHLYKRRTDGKLYSSKSECGRGHYTPNGAPNVMHKSNAFKLFYESGEECCQTCLNRAKIQGRV
jgi:hypothetical protein